MLEVIDAGLHQIEDNIGIIRNSKSTILSHVDKRLVLITV